MVDVISNLCKDKFCKKQASFDYPNGKGVYCFTHKLEDMINIKIKHCHETGCY